MSIRNIYRRVRGHGGPRTYSANADAARRATRARDHLEHKREQERRRRARERAHAEHSDLRSPNRGIVSTLVFVFALGTGIVVGRPLLTGLFLSHREPIEQIEVQGASTLSPEAIVRAAGLGPLESLETIDPITVANAVETEPWIESARVLRLPTGGLVISVVEKNAIARYRVDPHGETMLVDPQGQRFGGALEPGGPLPLITGIDEDPETPLPEEALEILHALNQFTSLKRDPSSLTLFLPNTEAQKNGEDPTGDQTGYVLQFGERGPRALLGRRLFPERVARLAALVENGESAFLTARVIDLRYADRAVLRTEPVSG